MPKFPTLLVGLILFCSNLQAQQYPVSGIISDTSTAQSLQHAVVSILRAQDSVLVSFTRADARGNYSLLLPGSGNYIIWIMHPQFADFVEEVEIRSAGQRLDPISLTPKSKLLEAVIIQSGQPIRVKGDTTIYTADSFHVAPNANVEELLKVLPGMQVDKDGKITAMGETVQKVLVDGEEFFGEDPGMAVKNLRADAVKEVQVFDKKSEQAEFTGIDDGNTQKTINLRLKDDRKKGYFGKIDLSGGLMDDIDDRYNNNVMFNSFKGKRKLSGFFLLGNTGQDGLGWEDSEKYGGGNDNVTLLEDGGIMVTSGGGSDGEPYVNTKNGFTKNINLGLHYSNSWTDKHKFNFSPQYNEQDYSNATRSYTQTQLESDSVLNRNRNQVSHVNRSNIKLNALYDIKLDSFSTIKIKARTGIYKTASDESNISETTGASHNLKNSTNQAKQLESDRTLFAGSVNFLHKFKKARRTFSLLVDINTNSSVGENYLQSTDIDYSGFSPNVINKNQMMDNEKQTSSLSSKMVYTEPLSQKYSLELGYELSRITGENNLYTYNYDAVSNKFDELVDTLSNEFDQLIVVHKPSVKISYQTKKINFNFGSGFGITEFDFEDKTYNELYQREYTNIFPTASFKYNYKSNHSLNFNYYGSNRQPTLAQLQPLRNSDNQFYQVLGNPDLKPSFNHNFQVAHNGYNFLKDLWMYQSLNFNYTNQAITNEKMIDAQSGKTITRPVNIDGNYSISLWSGMGFKWKKPDIRVGVNPNLSYNKRTEIINSKISHSDNLNLGLSFNLSKSKAKKYDVSLSNGFTYNQNKNAQTDELNRYNNYNGYFYGLIYYKKVWQLRTDMEWNMRHTNQTLGEDINTLFWNASLQRSFKNDEFTVYLTVKDILNQNIGFTQSYYGNTYSETENRRLQRYFLLGFKWDFMNKGSKTK